MAKEVAKGAAVTKTDSAKSSAAVKKPRRAKRQTAADKPWSASTLAGFGVGTEEYWQSRMDKDDDDFSV